MSFVAKVLCAAALVLPVSCSSDDADKTQEPVAPTTEQTPYPEDPDMAQGDKKEAPTAEAPKTDDSEPVGELTNDPFKDKAPGDDKAATADSEMPGTAPSETPAPVDDGDALQGGIGSGQPNYEAAPGSLTEAPSVPGEAPAGKHKGKGGKVAGGHGKGKTVRYVDAVMLNVRSQPNFKSPVVRKLLGGAKVNVDVKGKWAKLKDGQWIRTKYLSEAPTRKVSRAEAETAMKGAAKAGKAKGKKAHAAKGKHSKKKAAAAAPAPVEAAPAAEAAPADVAPVGGDVTAPTEAAPESGAGGEPQP